MAGHFPFLGRGVRYGGARMTIAAFFEAHGLNEELQEKYYKWWYDWAKNFVEQDEGLKAAKGVAFQHYPYGQHAHRPFHLHSDKIWAVHLADLGDLIRDSLLPKLDAKARKTLEQAHAAMLEELKQEAASKPRQPAPEVGYFRHI